MVVIIKKVIPYEIILHENKANENRLTTILIINYNGDWTAFSHPDVMTVYV